MKKTSKRSLYSFVFFIEKVAPDLPFINDLKSPPYYYFAKKDGRGENGTEKRDLPEASGPATPLPCKISAR